jgi:peptide/nickel transport system ATP-binding protein
MLKVENISKIYKVGTFGGKELHAVNNVSFDVCNCEVTSLIGESGSGKSTIGKMILRLISISSGKIWFNDTDITTYQGAALKEYYRLVQGVFQDPFCSYNPIFKADRIFQSIHDEFFPQVSRAEWQDKVNCCLQDVGMNPEHVLNKYPHQLSGGQLQRFLIARALLLNIKFLVADEIISMLDASTRIDVLNLLAELKTGDLSILFITHDLSLANYISERALILYHGCAVENGITHTIFNHPVHPYTRMLIASVPRLDQHWEKIEADIERKTRALEVTHGCVYFDRCPLADKALGCADNQPEPVEVEDGHFVACYRAITG